MALTTTVKIILTVAFGAFSFGGYPVKANNEVCYHFINETAGYGIIKSPNYPRFYSSNQKCIWLLENTDKIKLVFDSFDLENHAHCSYDYVALYDGRSENEVNLLGKFCGNTIPEPITSTTNQLLVVFSSDARTDSRGFKATYTKEPKVRSILKRIRSIPDLEETERNLTQYFLRTRRQEKRSINKWGSLITKAAISLFLNDHWFFPFAEEEEIAYELSLQLLSKLALKKKIPTKDLALYINALTVTCIDPKNFFGTNLVDELRSRVSNSNHTDPFSILTLCNAKDNMTKDHVLKLQQLYDAHFRPVWTDTQAMVVMALSCIHFRSNVDLDPEILDEMVVELKQKQQKNGTVDNLKTTALVLQALIAAKNYEKGFDFKAAVQFILQEVRRTYPNSQEIFYILPIFKMMSFANINFSHCATHVETDLQLMTNLHEHLDTRIPVQVSIVIGNGMNFTRTWKMKVPSNFSFYQMLENISHLEPSYQVQYSFSGGKPYVVGLAKHQDDIEEGMFWFTYSKPLSSEENPKPIAQSPVDIQVKESEELILWYKSGAWVNSDEDSLG